MRRSAISTARSRRSTEMADREPQRIAHPAHLSGDGCPARRPAPGGASPAVRSALTGTPAVATFGATMMGLVSNLPSPPPGWRCGCRSRGVAVAALAGAAAPTLRRPESSTAGSSTPPEPRSQGSPSSWPAIAASRRRPPTRRAGSFRSASRRRLRRERRARRASPPSSVAVRLETGGRATLDFRLALATEDRIDVVATAPLIDPTSPAPSRRSTPRSTAELVFATRNYQSVVASLPGVVISAGSSGRAHTVGERRPVAGERGVRRRRRHHRHAASAAARGSSCPRARSPRCAATPPATASSTAAPSAASPEPSPSRAPTIFHGDFLYVAQNPSWRAQSEVVPVDREDHLISSYEASLGGPIVRDRAWFFAAAADNTTNQLSPLAGGEVIDSSFAVGLDRRQALPRRVAPPPRRRHRHRRLGIVALGHARHRRAPRGDRRRARDEFRDRRLGLDRPRARRSSRRAPPRQRASSDREPIASRTTQPGASPDDPAGNQGAYWDNASGLRWHASDLPLGPGTLEFPRDQANAALTWLLDRNELELGADYQDVGWEALNRPPDRYLGRGYDPSRPGGFADPGAQARLPSRSTLRWGPARPISPLFAQDRVDVGERLSVSFGLRLEDQAHDDDRGRRSPRLDRPRAARRGGVRRRRRRAGSWSRPPPAATSPTSRRTSSTRSSRACPTARTRSTSTSGTRDPALRPLQSPPAPRVRARRSRSVEPYAKDEVTAGIEWQMSRRWALDARAIAWRIEAPFSATDQFDAEGGVYRLLTNFAAAEREYRGAPDRARSRLSRRARGARQLHAVARRRQLGRQHRRPATTSSRRGRCSTRRPGCRSPR